MSITIQAWEDWGPTAFGAGVTRTPVTNLNLKCWSDPAQNYYLNDVQRPYLQGVHMCSFTRFFSFRISGTYSRFKNARIVIPSGFAPDNWRVMYRMTSTYVEPVGAINEFGRMAGVFDGACMTLTEETTLYPFFSTDGPWSATTRPVSIGPNQTVWTNWLVLQFMAHPSDFDDVDNFGTGDIKLLLDEMEL